MEGVVIFFSFLISFTLLITIKIYIFLKKWLSVLIGERKLKKKKNCHLSWDKLKRKTCYLERDGRSMYQNLYFSNYFYFYEIEGIV